MFGSNIIPKEIKKKINDKDFLYEFKLKESNIKNLIIKIDKNIDLISETNIIFNENYIANEEKIKEMFNVLKKDYDLILIDTNEDSKYIELIKILSNLSYKTICIMQANLIYVKKTINLINDVTTKEDEISIICNKQNKYSMNKKMLEFMFYKHKIIGTLSYSEEYDKIINKNVNTTSINKKIKEEFRKNY